MSTGMSVTRTDKFSSSLQPRRGQAIRGDSFSRCIHDRAIVSNAFFLPADPTAALKAQIGILEGDVKAVEDNISATEQKIDEATRTKIDKIDKDVDYWSTKIAQLRTKEAQLRTKEAQLRDQLKRKEVQLQGGKPSFTVHRYFQKRVSSGRQCKPFVEQNRP
jgi:septal ring factor EnvC (AmiA/AmiB activator)